jgi:dihydroorotate dehydrogenase
MASFETHPLHPGLGVPLFIAAGVLKEPWQIEAFFNADDPNLVPLLSLGTFTYPVSPGNASTKHPTDFVYYEKQKMAGNARGLPGGGIEAMRALNPSIRILNEIGIRSVVSITNLPSERAMDVIPYLVEEAAALEPTAIEVNLSCPNGLKPDGSLHAPLCNDADATGEVMQAARERVGPEVCLGGKDSPHVRSIGDVVYEEEVARLISAINPNVNFLTGINTIGNQDFPEITSTGGRGGMSGPIVAGVARSWLRIARAHAAENVAILSCGGVDAANLVTELQFRQGSGALLVGGAQEFYRSGQPHVTAQNWVQQLQT